MKTSVLIRAHERLEARIDALAARLAVLERSAVADVVTGVDREMTSVLLAVADTLGVSPAAMMGRGRTRRVAWARHVAMYLCREIGRSANDVGGHFCRDGTTVTHSCRAVRDAIECPGPARIEVASCRDGREIPAPGSTLRKAHGLANTLPTPQPPPNAFAASGPSRTAGANGGASLLPPVTGPAGSAPTDAEPGGGSVTAPAGGNPFKYKQ